MAKNVGAKLVFVFILIGAIAGFSLLVKKLFMSGGFEAEKAEIIKDENISEEEKEAIKKAAQDKKKSALKSPFLKEKQASTKTVPKVKPEDLSTSPPAKFDIKEKASPLMSGQPMEDSPVSPVLLSPGSVEVATSTIERPPIKEGYLSIDRANQLWTVTLGTQDGLKAGSRLGVYDSAGMRVGTVEVDTALRIIAYVHASGQSIEQFRQNQYRVVIE